MSIGIKSIKQHLTVRALYLLSVIQAQFFPQLATQPHFMAVVAGGCST